MRDVNRNGWIQEYLRVKNQKGLVREWIWKAKERTGIENNSCIWFVQLNGDATCRNREHSETAVSCACLCVIMNLVMETKNLRFYWKMQGKVSAQSRDLGWRFTFGSCGYIEGRLKLWVCRKLLGGWRKGKGLDQILKPTLKDSRDQYQPATEKWLCPQRRRR